MTVVTAGSVRFGLVGTSHPGNIGAAARAMKTMGFTALDLVAAECAVDEQSTAMAAGAADVVASARVVTDLTQAVADSTLVLGLTARTRRDGVPALSPAEAGALVAAEPGPVSILFGRERTGLTNDELACCQRLVHIPANPDYPSLNLAAAVQIMAYELRGAMLRESSAEGTASPEALPASGAHLEGLHAELAALVDWTGYSANQPRTVLLRRLRNFVNRSRPSVDEVNLLRGLLKRTRR